LRLEQFRHRLDLGSAWQKETGLPFVFALWAIRSDCVSERLVELLRLAFTLGHARISQIADQWAFSNQFPVEIARRYLREHIRYQLDDSCRESIALFSRTSPRKIQYYGAFTTDRPNFGRKAAVAG
jgi:predicted solute-binding protein